LAAWIGAAVLFNLPVSTDEGSYLFQASSFMDGRLVRPYPPMGALLRRPDDMLIMSPSVGWLSRYPPGHAIWLLPGALLGAPRVMVLVACGASVIVMMLLAKILGGSPFLAGFVLLASPYYLLMHGTLLSHSSGFLAVCLLLFFYIKLRQTGLLRYGIFAGLAWSLFFLNRTYSAFLIAVPFALDSLWHLARRRDRTAWVETLCFAGAASLGVLGYIVFNTLVTGDPHVPTYLLYDSTQTLGFGMRHLRGLPVDHSFIRGLTNAWINLLTLDKWLFGIPLGFVAIAILGVIGSFNRFGFLLWGGFLVLVGGYVFFWFPGPRHIGPAYYFEGVPFLLLLGSIGGNRVLLWMEKWTWKRHVLVIALMVLVVVGSIRFLIQQKEYFHEQLASQRVLSETLANAPPNALVFWRNVQYPPFGKITVNEHGLATQPLVLSCPGPEHYAAIMSFFVGHTAYQLYGETPGVLVKVDMDALPALPAHKVNAEHLPRFTGRNQPDEAGNFIRVAKESEDGAHYLAYGFHRFLPPGKYVATFNVVAAEGTASSSARFDVATDQGRVRLAEMPVPHVSGEQKIELFFTIPGSDFLRVEPRVFYGGVGRLALRGISIRRVK
jgi:hypothetical protein